MHIKNEYNYRNEVDVKIHHAFTQLFAFYNIEIPGRLKTLHAVNVSVLYLENNILLLN